MSGDPRLPDLFARASELAGAERQAWLEDLRREDPSLAREIEELLAAASQGERQFAKPALDRLTPAGRSPAILPERVGPYSIMREIGRGGMGRVFLAEQEEEEFHRRVALKVIARPGFADENVRRFRDEVRILATLEHPGIARFLDGGRDSDGTWYLAMEYVEGEDLVSYTRGQGLDLRQRVELFLQVAEAVDFAHRRLVVHRDLKPANVLVGADGRARLLDFGVSKILDPEAGEDATRTELRAFTPAYASPEQLRGERATVAADVYSLGVMLYELLAGRRPFERRGAAGLDFAALERDPQPPSTVARETAPATSGAADTAVTLVRWRDLAGDLDAITLKALRSKPQDRYASAAVLADDLRRWLDGRPVVARRGGRRYRVAKFIRRHRLPVAFAALAAAALVASTLVAVRQARASARERDRALADLRRAEITNDLSAFLLSEAAPAVGKPVSKADLLARGEAVIDRRFATDPALRVHMLLTVAERYYENYQFEDWRRSVERAFALSRNLSEPSLRIRSACTMAFVHASLGDRDRAASELAEGLRELELAPGEIADEAACRRTESNAALLSGDTGRAVRAGERSLAIERARRGPPGLELEALNTLANAYAADGRFADADRAFTELMSSFEAQGRERTHGAAICLNNWAAALQGAGQMSRAVDLARRAVDLARSIDPDRGATPVALWTLGGSESFVGRDDAALAAVEEAVAKARLAGSPLHLFWALWTAGDVAVRAGRLALADERLRELESLARGQAPLPPRMQGGLDRLRALAGLAHGDVGLAVERARQAVAELDAAARPPREVAPALLVLAAALNAQGDFAGARAAAERAAGIAVGRLGGFAHSREFGLAELELGLALAGSGDQAAAAAALDSAIDHLRGSVGEAVVDTRRAIEARRRLGA